MSKTTANRPKGFTYVYVIAMALVAITCAIAIMADKAPSFLTPLTSHIDTNIAVFVVPLAMLMFAIIAEVIHVSLVDAVPRDNGRPVRSLHHWSPGRGEG